MKRIAATIDVLNWFSDFVLLAAIKPLNQFSGSVVGRCHAE